MMFKRHLAALSLAALMIVAPLAGCGSKDSSTSTKTEDASSSTTATTTNTDSSSNTTTDDSTKKLTGDFEIQYFVGGYGDKWWKKVIADFKAANPDLNVKESGGPKIIRPDEAPLGRRQSAGLRVY